MLYVILCADLIPDRPFWGGDRASIRKRKLTWFGFEEIGSCLEAVRESQDSFGERGKLAGFARADEALEDILGQRDFIFRRFASALDGLDEVGWHPQMERWEDNRWVQETADTPWMVKNLTETHALISQERAVKSCRMGWNFHNNGTMKALMGLGIAVDTSALPGLKTGGGWFDRLKDRYYRSKTCVSDWRKAPQQPYYPREDDYQAGDGGGPLLEIPVSVYRGKAWNPCRPLALNQGLLQHYLTASAASERFLVGAFHSDELCFHRAGWWFKALARKAHRFSSLLYLRENLRYLEQQSRQQRRGFKYVTPCEAASLWHPS